MCERLVVVEVLMWVHQIKDGPIITLWRLIHASSIQGKGFAAAVC